MASYLVTYDLIKQKNYAPLIEQLKQYNYWHCLDSTWIIESNGTAEALRNLFGQHIDADDKLIVLKLTGEAAWTTSFPQNCQVWLRKNL